MCSVPRTGVLRAELAIADLQSNFRIVFESSRFQVNETPSSARLTHSGHFWFKPVIVIASKVLICWDPLSGQTSFYLHKYTDDLSSIRIS